MSFFGESIPKSVTSKHPGISPEIREELFEEYMGRKSTEHKSDILRTTASGAVAGVFAAHGIDEAKKVMKRKVMDMLKNKKTGKDIFSKAQSMALNIIKKMLPDASHVPLLKNYSKGKLTAALAGIGAVYGFNRAMTSAMEQDRAKGYRSNKSRMRKELAVRLSEQ